MKGLVFCIILTLFVFTSAAYADTEVSPHIEGETFFNETVDLIQSGDFTINPVKLINNVVTDFTMEIRSSTKIVVPLLLISVLSAILNMLS